MKKRTLSGVISLSALALGMVAFTQPANAGIANTRHNLGTGGVAAVASGLSGVRTTSTLGMGSGTGDVWTNGTDEICVFCHTPHGANNTQANLPPLWNKATPANNTYVTYTSGSMNGTAPTNLSTSMSIACLSCHDGTQAMDNMINQPGQGGFNRVDYMSGLRVGLANKGGVTTGATGNWFAGSNDMATAEMNAGDTSNGQLITGAGVDFIGTDLSNDHPIGMAYGGGGCTSQSTGTHVQSTTCSDKDFYDPASGLGGMFELAPATATAGAKTNMRIYGTTVGTATVECGSCHDPHTDAQKTFLRTSNAGSNVCLTCHVK